MSDATARSHEPSAIGRALTRVHRFIVVTSVPGAMLAAGYGLGMVYGR